MGAWRPQRIAADLQRLRGLNANTVRIVLPANFFGYPVARGEYQERLREFVDIAARNGLRVQLTLFDWWGDYRDVEGSKQWARAVLEPYVGDPRIAFVELRNEIDTTDADAARVDARAGSRGCATSSEADAGDASRSAGMRPVRDLRALVAALPARARPDFFDAHHFTGGGELARAGLLDAPRRRGADAAVDRRARLPDVDDAHSGFAGVPLTPSGQEAAQEHYFKLCFGALAPARAACAGDLDPGRLRARRHSAVGPVAAAEPEYHFGLFREDGSAKPAAAAVRRLFAGTLETGFNGGFEAAAAAEDGTVGARDLGLDGRAAARSRHDGGAIRRRVRSGRRPRRRERDVPDHPGHRSGARAAARSSRRGFAARGGASRRDRLVRLRGPPGRAEVDVGTREASLAAEPRSSPSRRREPRSRGLSVRAHGLNGSVWVDDVSFGWR